MSHPDLHLKLFVVLATRFDKAEEAVKVTYFTVLAI